MTAECYYFYKRLSNLEIGFEKEIMAKQSNSGYYLDVMAGQHLLHMAIQENNFYFRLHGLKRMLPFFFALNKQNYAHYGLLYVHYLENLDAAQSGCRELIQEKGLSVQGQDRYPARIPIAQRGSRQLIEIKNLQEE